MEDKYRLILEDFEGSSSLALELSARRTPRKREMFHFDAGELLQEGDCAAQEERNKAINQIRELFNGDYKVMEVANEVLNQQDGFASGLKVIARSKTKLTFF